MTAFTTVQLKAVGIPPASTDITSYPGTIVADYVFDGLKQALASADTADFFDLPDLTGCVVLAAAVTIVTASPNAATLALQVGGTSVTGLTGWALNGTAGTKLVKLATAANTVVNAGSASAIRMLIGGAALSTGKFRVRVWYTLLESPPV
jgi:hypothetical protein